MHHISVTAEDLAITVHLVHSVLIDAVRQTQRFPGTILQLVHAHTQVRPASGTWDDTLFRVYAHFLRPYSQVVNYSSSALLAHLCFLLEPQHGAL